MRFGVLHLVFFLTYKINILERDFYFINHYFARGVTYKKRVRYIQKEGALHTKRGCVTYKKRVRYIQKEGALHTKRGCVTYKNYN